MLTLQLELPTHWAVALMYGEYDGFDEQEEKQIAVFEKYMEKEYGGCWCIEVDSWRTFQHTHDATDFGVLPCDVSTYTFDITPEK